MRRAGEALRAEIARMSDEALARNQPKWLVSLDEPTERLFATRADGSLANLLAVLYGDRIASRTLDTDRADVACVVSEVPMCVLGVTEQFMPLLVPTLRANGVRGSYHKAGTEIEYRF